MMAIALVLLIWLGKMTGLCDPGGREFPEIQDRHLTVAGTVAGREAYAGGCRVILDSLSFLADGSGSFLIVRSDTMLSHMIQYDTEYFFVFFGCDPAIRTGDYMMCSSCEKSGNNISIRVSPHRVL